MRCKALTVYLREGAGLALLLAASLLGTKPSAAADISVYTSGAAVAVQKTIAANFTTSTGHRILFTTGTLREIQNRLSGNEKPDVLVLPAPAMDALGQAGTLRSGSRINLARVGIGVAVREGAPLPDISSVDALRKTLLNARSIAHSDPEGGGFAGAQVVRMFAQLGIAEAVKPKVVLMYAFTGGVENIAKAEAEIGLFNISEILPVKGVTLVGPLPPEVQSYITFAGALHVGGGSTDAATAYLRSLSDPGARDTWKTRGFETLGSAY